MPEETGGASSVAEAYNQATAELSTPAEGTPKPEISAAEVSPETPISDSEQFQKDMNELASLPDGFKRLQQKWGPKLERLSHLEKEFETVEDLRRKATAFDEFTARFPQAGAEEEEPPKPTEPTADELDADTQALLAAYPGLETHLAKVVGSKVEAYAKAFEEFQQERKLEKADRQIEAVLSKIPAAEAVISTPKFAVFLKEHPGLTLEEGYQLYTLPETLKAEREKGVQEAYENMKKKGESNLTGPSTSSGTVIPTKPKTFAEAWAGAKQELGVT